MWTRENFLLAGHMGHLVGSRSIWMRHFALRYRKDATVCLMVVGVCFLNGCGALVPIAPSNAVSNQGSCPPIPTPTLSAEPTNMPLRSPPTLAPTATPGPPLPVQTPEPPATLAVPLMTREQLLERVFAFERFGMDGWDEPWCVQTLRFDPDRISFERFDTLEQAEGGWRNNNKFEPVWMVTIRGRVVPRMIGWRNEGKANYVRYTIGEKSGMLYHESAGMSLPPPTIVTSTPRTPKTPQAGQTKRARRTPTP